MNEWRKKGRNQIKSHQHVCMPEEWIWILTWGRRCSPLRRSPAWGRPSRAWSSGYPPCSRCRAGWLLLVLMMWSVEERDRNNGGHNKQTKQNNKWDEINNGQEQWRHSSLKVPTFSLSFSRFVVIMNYNVVIICCYKGLTTTDKIKQAPSCTSSLRKRLHLCVRSFSRGPAGLTMMPSNQEIEHISTAFWPHCVPLWH